jgi:hypothetical protein
MADSQLRKVEGECARLQMELKTLRTAMPTKSACTECVSPVRA